MDTELGKFTPYQYSGNKDNKDNKSRMAGDYLKDFAQSNVGKVLSDGKEGENKSPTWNSPNASYTNKVNNTNERSKQNKNQSVQNNNYGSSTSPVQPTDDKYVPTVQGGTAGLDYPDPNDGNVVVNNNGTMSQTTADGKRIEWGTQEALQSAVKSKEDKKFSVTNRKVDYETNLPSDFDPSGKDAYGHNMWLYEITGNQIFLDTANGMKNL